MVDFTEGIVFFLTKILNKFCGCLLLVNFFLDHTGTPKWNVPSLKKQGVPGGVSVEVSSHVLNLKLELCLGPLGGAFEGHVLQEVGYAVVGCRLVSRSSLNGINNQGITKWIRSKVSSTLTNSFVVVVDVQLLY